MPLAMMCLNQGCPPNHQEGDFLSSLRTNSLQPVRRLTYRTYVTSWNSAEIKFRDFQFLMVKSRSELTDKLRQRRNRLRRNLYIHTMNVGTLLTNLQSTIKVSAVVLVRCF